MPMTARLCLEDLEGRCTPAVFVAEGTLYLLGGNAADYVRVRMEYPSGVPHYAVTDNGVASLVPAAAVYRGEVVFAGLEDDDSLDALGVAARVYAYGYGGSDALVGGSGDDYLDGGPGPDFLSGRGGNDTLVAGPDATWNVLWGGAGDDTLSGGYGDDVLTGDVGNDVLFGGEGNDHLFGGQGRDSLYGQQGADRLDGGLDGERDSLVGGGGADHFRVEPDLDGRNDFDRVLDFNPEEDTHEFSALYY
jgi:Ca2+-binding RTX toxin-like protein